MKVSEVKTANIMTKSHIPGIDYVVNPYIGCQHGCIYCYAEFMKRFTKHTGDAWGEFLDIKRFDLEKIKSKKFDGKTIMLSSVTDPYTPLEAKYQNTRMVLERLVTTNAEVSILTKSKLVERDIPLFKQFRNIHVGVSLSTLDSSVQATTEPRASKPLDRLDALKRVASHGISTYIFVSPIFPGLTSWQEIVDYASSFTDDFRFENLNFRSHNISRIFSFISSDHPNLAALYERVRHDSSSWDTMAADIESYCKSSNVKCRVEFHHGGFTRKARKNSY
jgi:DNA repair photolyase